MRSDREFIAEYRDVLADVDPSTGSNLDIERVRTLAQTELCLSYLCRFLPEESVRAVPFLMMGYAKLLNGADDDDAASAMMTLRHLCGRFGSVSAWADATVQYGRMPEVIRCFKLHEHRAVLRNAAPESLRSLLDRWLLTTVPWTQRKVQVAGPGEATVIMDRGHTKLSYTVPTVSAEKMQVRKHALSRRSVNPPIRISMEELLAHRRGGRCARGYAGLAKGKPAAPRSRGPPWEAPSAGRRRHGFFRRQDVHDQWRNTHVVGMLSSGKSTFVLALLFALALGGSGKRIATLVTDTIHGATLAARLRRHGVRATVLSSLRNRPRHLHGIHWQRSLDATGWSLSSLGDLADGFSTACPLDGAQPDPEIVEGTKRGRSQFPEFPEKQCHRLHQKTPPDEDEEVSDPDDVADSGKAESCPLWACCPAQEQQRSSVDAQVVIMTPQAFVHITPDKWTTEK